MERSTCPECSKKLSDKRNLNRHLKVVHNIKPDMRRSVFTCSFEKGCVHVCSNQESFRKHLWKDHQFVVQCEIKHFQSKEDFEKWKNKLEQSMFVSYISYTGTKKRGTENISYLRCNRSGQSRGDILNRGMRKRSLKKSGYVQTGAICPSTMTVTEARNKEITVTYYKTHLGHCCTEESSKYLRLKNEDKNQIGVKLAQGSKVSDIIQQIKCENKSSGKINFLKKVDVYNISRNLEILKKQGGEDGLIIDNWLKNGKFGNTVVDYKTDNNGRDFLLIIIHPLQKNVGVLLCQDVTVYICSFDCQNLIDYQLIILFIVDKNNFIVPIAYLITSQLNHKNLSHFYNVVANQIGVIKPDLFVSRNTSLFYTVWKCIMLEADDVIMCNFDLMSKWRQKLVNMDEDKKLFILKKLEHLLTITDITEFECSLVELMTDLMSEQTYSKFSNYFAKHYVGNWLEWSNCNTKRVDLFIKPTYDYIRKLYLASIEQGTVCLEDVFYFTRDKIVEFAMRNNIVVIDDLVAKIDINHDLALISNFPISYQNKNDWIVADGDVNYTVSLRMQCDVNKCILHCKPCQICIHSYVCSCLSYLNEFVICQHVHTVVKHNANNFDTHCTDDNVFLHLENDEVSNNVTTSEEFETENIKQITVSAAEQLTKTLKESSLSLEKYLGIMGKINMLIEEMDS